MKKLLNIAPYRVNPPLTGGHAAIFYPNKLLSASFEIFLFTMGMRRGELKLPVRPIQFNITDHFAEYCYVTYLSILLTFYSSARSGIPPINLSTVLRWLKPAMLIEQIRQADFIQVEFPWQFEWVHRQNARRVPIVLVEHNIEFKVLESKPRGSLQRALVHKVKGLEEEAVQQADAVITFTQEDKEVLKSLWGSSGERVKVIPCGVDTDFFRPCTEDERLSAKERLGFTGKKVVLFVGHLWSANVEAVKEVEQMAQRIQRADAIFVVAGRVGERFQSHGNIFYTGFVEDIRPYLDAADIAINPMVSGTGMNLKMLEFLASGLPTITTSAGARGIKPDENHAFLLIDLKEFPDAIHRLLADPQLCDKLGTRGRQLVGRKYSWTEIAKQRAALYHMLISGHKADLGPSILKTRSN